MEAQNEAREKDAELYFEKEPTDKLQHVLDIKQKERNEKIKVLSSMKKLTEEEKGRILKSIRYSFLPQDVLLRLSTDEAFLQAKEFIVQGIAVLLGGPNHFDSDQLKINVKPRQIVEQTQSIGHD